MGFVMHPKKFGKWACCAVFIAYLLGFYIGRYRPRIVEYGSVKPVNQTTQVVLREETSWLSTNA